MLGQTIHVGGEQQRAENSAPKLATLSPYIIDSTLHSFIFSSIDLAHLPVWAPFITSLSSAPFFFLRIVDRSAAGPAFAARHPCRLRLPSSPHLPLLSCRFYSSKKKKMPPKKAQVQEKVLLGRPGNSLKSGIVCELGSPLFFSFLFFTAQSTF